MLKVSIPDVKHKMSSDGLIAKFVRQSFRKPRNRPPTFVGDDELPSAPLNNVVLRGDVIEQLKFAESPKKMLRLRIPEDAVN
jgi:hypothetical protein